MLDLRMPWQPTVRPTPGPLWRSLALVLSTSAPYTRDPSPLLLEPAEDAAHTARRVSIPIGAQAMPGWLFEPKRPAGPTVCLVHGTSAYETVAYYFWIRSLLKADVRVLTFELDGHGDNPRAMCLPGLDDNIPAALRFLREQPGVDPDRVGLLGVSLGGACALNAAAADRAVKAVVTVSMPQRIAVDDWHRLAETLGTLNPELLPVLARVTPDRLLSFLTAPLRVAQGLDHPHELTTFLDEDMPHAVNRALRYLNPLDNAARLVNTPLLVINGEWDNIAPPWQALDLYERAGGPKALSMVPRRNHFSIMVSRPAVEAATHWFRRWL